MFREEAQFPFSSLTVIEPSQFRASHDNPKGNKSILRHDPKHDGRKRDRSAPDTPTIFEIMDRYATSDGNRRLVQVLTAAEEFGHPMIALPRRRRIG